MLTASDFSALCDKSREIGEGRYVAQCPAHKGSQNFYISDGDKGTVFYCHAGCKKEDILESLGLTWSDVFSGSAPKRMYDPIDDAMVLLLYRTDSALGKQISTKDARFVNAAGSRLHKNGYILNREGKLKKRVKNIRETNQPASQHPRNL